MDHMAIQALVDLFVVLNQLHLMDVGVDCTADLDTELV